MARDLDERQRAELTDFVNAIASAAGYTTTAEWARDSGYPASNLSNLRNGRGGVDGFNLLRLIRAAAARAENMTAEQLALGVAQASADTTEESIARRLDELAGLMKEALDELRERPAPHEAQRQTPLKSRSQATKRAAR